MGGRFLPAQSSRSPFRYANEKVLSFTLARTSEFGSKSSGLNFAPRTAIKPAGFFHLGRGLNP